MEGDRCDIVFLTFKKQKKIKVRLGSFYKHVAGLELFGL